MSVTAFLGPRFHVTSRRGRDDLEQQLAAFLAQYLEASEALRLDRNLDAAAAMDGGDSGSPIFAWTPAGHSFVSLCGVAHSSPEDALGFWFSPLGNVYSYFGGLDTVHANEPPTVTITSPAYATDLGTGVLPQVSLEAEFSDLEDGGGCAQCVRARLVFLSFTCWCC